jgi:hypothetical protein
MSDTMVSSPLAALLGSLVLVIVVSGCGDGGSGNYQAIHGSVTFRGEPLDDGTIQFFGVGEQPGLRGGAMIRDGSYELPREHGLAPGTYLVRISSTERIAKAGTSSMNPFHARERLPAKYNAQSKLTVEVGSRNQGAFDFNLD